MEAAFYHGADAIGLNFVPSSARYLRPDDRVTRRLAEFCQQNGLKAVGLFVNTQTSTVREVVQSLGLGAVQLHGDETLQQAGELMAAGIEVFRAVRLPTSSLSAATIDAAVTAWIDLGVGILLDADVGNHFGGQGTSLDWHVLARWSKQHAGPWMLAGGLRPETVGKAISICQPHGVDVASGVERPRGTKAPELIEQFCRHARQQFSLLE